MSDRILIVDDSLTVRMDLQEAFDEAGFACTTCADLASGQEHLVQQRPDVVVLDVLLPDGNGVDLLREIRARPDGHEIVVLMLSSEADVRHRLHGLDMGADEYVGKPYDRGYVTTRARELLRAHRAAAAATAPARAPTVLLIDDSPSFREALRERLQQAGYQVLLAASGEEGLRVAAAARPDLLLVDKQLPGIDGPTVIRRLRLDAVLRSVPCILLTASEALDSELLALEAGADAFVRKEADDTVVLARLAAVLRSARHPAAEANERRGGAGALGPKRILAVDDSASFLAELSEMLVDEGYEVLAASSGQQALDLLGAQPVDIILMDLNMPGMDGREACRRIKAAPVLRDVPLLILTASEDPGTMLETLEVGADDYIQKSADFEVLKARVRAQLRRRQFEDENRRIRLDLLNMEMEAAEARAASELAASRAELLAELERKNAALERANRDLAEANEAKTDFMATMSHELRTPLNAIIGFSELLREGMTGPLQPRQIEFCGHIHDSGRHLLALINDILDLAKIEAGKVEIQAERLDVAALLDEAAIVLRERAQARRIRLEIEHGDDDALRTELHADRRRLKQILLNLLSNAVKFSADGGVVSVRTRVVDRVEAGTAIPGESPEGLRTPLPPSEHRHFLEFSVLDQGIGMAHADLDRLFKPFGQIRNLATRELEGTGLGLVTVARLVTLHQGAVAVSSRPGAGSCFSFWLPLDAEGRAEPDDDELDFVAESQWASPALPPQSPAPATPTSRPAPWALVVEDDQAGAELMRVQLEAEGFAVRLAASAEIALQMADSFTPDLITLDIHLPGMDGWQLLCRIQELPRWAEVPVVVVSLDVEHGVGASLGAAAVMRKPIRRSEFARELGALGFQPSRSGKVTVLLIDDAGNAEHETLKAELTQPGYAVLHARGGQQGIALSREHLPDLVVLDLLIQDMGGMEVAEALKSDQRTAEIPVIMLAARQFTEADREHLNRHVKTVVEQADSRPDRFLGEVKRAFGRGTRMQ